MSTTPNDITERAAEAYEHGYAARQFHSDGLRAVEALVRQDERAPVIAALKTSKYGVEGVESIDLHDGAPSLADCVRYVVEQRDLECDRSDEWEQEVRQDERERLLATLDDACLGRTAVSALRWAGNKGRPLKGRSADGSGRYVSTHVAGDLCNLADALERIRSNAGYAKHADPANTGTQPAAKPAPTPHMALRPHHEHPDEMDDIVVKDATMFRAEQMDNNHWWMCCCFANGERVTFDVHASEPANLYVTVGEEPSSWVDIDEKRRTIPPRAPEGDTT